MEADYLNCQEAAERLGCTRQHISRLARRGELTGRKIGRDWVVSRESVQQYATRRANLALPLTPHGRTGGTAEPMLGARS